MPLCVGCKLDAELAGRQNVSVTESTYGQGVEVGETCDECGTEGKGKPDDDEGIGVI